MTISRRSALKSIAAAAMAPLVQLRRDVPDERLLLAFCGDSIRYSIHVPFGIGSLTYATDSYAMVRAEIANRHECGVVRLPPVEEAWRKYWNAGSQWRPLTPDDITPTSMSEYRTGMTWSKCPECGNRRKSLGDTYPPMDTEEQLQRLARMDYDIDDNTVRDTSCSACCGSDFIGLDEVNVFGQWFKSYDLKRIVALPNVRVSAGEGNSLLFQADGFQGVALGLMQ